VFVYPTRRAIWLTALGAPVGLLLGALAPGLWLVGVGWAAVALALVAADVVLGADRSRLRIEVLAPASMGIGAPQTVTARAVFAGRAPAEAELALEVSDRLSAVPDRMRMLTPGRQGEASFEVMASRRGEARIDRLFVRWQGPLGLAWKQKVEALDRKLLVLPNIRAIQDEALRLFARDAQFGIKSQIELGEGSEYHALKEYMAGHDIGALDWKQSARHGKLLVKEFRTERNHNIVFALDTGRLMSEPLGGLPKVDRALNGALLLAYVGLKMGDRVGLYGFDERPRLSSGAVSGVGAFPLLQRLAAGLDYSAEETNYTLGLTTLAGELERRSLVVVFTDFADSTSAELMIENLNRLVRRHLVLFVAFRDEELEAMVRAEPATPEDVSRAVIAAGLLRERDVVISRLRRLGVDILEPAMDQIGPELVSRYLDLKRKDLL
jgi:uncharacterized protein (DUF58 family)